MTLTLHLTFFLTSLLRLLTLGSLFLSCLPLLIHYSQYCQKTSSSRIYNVLIEFQHETDIPNCLPSLFKILIKVSLLLQLNTTPRKTRGVYSRKTVLFFILSFVMHNIVLITYGMNVDVSTTLYSTGFSTLLHSYRVTATLRTLHILELKYYIE